MKKFVIEYTETVYYTTEIVAESEEQARELFMDGQYDNYEEFDREFGGIVQLYEE